MLNQATAIDKPLSVAKITQKLAHLCFPLKPSSVHTSLITDPSDCSLFRPRSLALRALSQLPQIRSSISGFSQLLRASSSVFLSPAFHLWDNPQAQEHSQSLTSRQCPSEPALKPRNPAFRDQSSVQPITHGLTPRCYGNMNFKQALAEPASSISAALDPAPSGWDTQATRVQGAPEGSESFSQATPWLTS